MVSNIYTFFNWSVRLWSYFEAIIRQIIDRTRKKRFFLEVKPFSVHLLRRMQIRIGNPIALRLHFLSIHTVIWFIISAKKNDQMILAECNLFQRGFWCFLQFLQCLLRMPSGWKLADADVLRVSSRVGGGGGRGTRDEPLSRSTLIQDLKIINQGQFRLAYWKCLEELILSHRQGNFNLKLKGKSRCWNCLFIETKLGWKFTLIRDKPNCALNNWALVFKVHHVQGPYTLSYTNSTFFLTIIFFFRLKVMSQNYHTPRW